MIVPDINLLVYAHNDQAPRHAKARTWWEVLLNGQEPVGLPWIAMGGFILPPFSWIALAQSAGAMTGDNRDSPRSKNETLMQQADIPPGVIEYGGLFHQQDNGFRCLMPVMLLAIGLVFAILIIEFRDVRSPIAIVTGSVLTLTGTFGALWLTHTTPNIISKERKTSR